MRPATWYLYLLGQAPPYRLLVHLDDPDLGRVLLLEPTPGR
jgi:hypothetical protein